MHFTMLLQVILLSIPMMLLTRVLLKVSKIRFLKLLLSAMYLITGDMPFNEITVHYLYGQTIINSKWNNYETTVMVKFFASALVIISLVYILLLCLLYYPVFACVDSAVPLVGHILGSMYTAIQ